MAQYNFPPSNSAYGPGDRTYKNMPGQRYGSSGPDANARGRGYVPYAQSEAEVARAQAKALADADQSDYLKRISQSRQNDFKLMEERKLFEQRAGRFASQNKIPIEQARQLLDPDNELGGARPKAPATPKQSALQKLLGKVSGRGLGGAAMRALGPLGFLPMIIEVANAVSGMEPLKVYYPNDSELGRMQ